MAQIFAGDHETKAQYHERMAPVYEALRAAGLNPIDVLVGPDPLAEPVAETRRPITEHPQGDGTGTGTHRPITGPTEKQLAFLAKLAAERGVEVPAVQTKREASAAIDRLLAAPKAAQPTAAPKTITAYPKVAAGHYATASRTGNNDLDFWRVDCPTKGKWAGYTFVKRVIGGHVDSPVRGGEAKQALEAILAAGEKAASVLYATKLERCSRCNRHLTDKASRDRGLGPECASKE